MLYIASALTPTPIVNAVKVAGFTSPESTSLVVAKPDRIQIWDVTAAGLEYHSELQLWGTIEGLATVSVENAHPHILVLVGPPQAFLYIVGFESGALTITDAQILRPPTPLLRRQEHFTAVVTSGATALVALWTGLLSVVEMDLQRPLKSERYRLTFKDGSLANINIREHNLVNLAFLPGTHDVVLFLWISKYSKLSVQARRIDTEAHSFTDLAPIVDVWNPLEYPLTLASEEADFDQLPFSCPAARKILPVGEGPNNSRLFLLIGDEYTVMYAVCVGADGPPVSPKSSPTRRRPQTETTFIGKKRKSSVSGRSVATDVENVCQVKPVWRVRQGYGDVLAATVINNSALGGNVLFGDECGRLTAVGWEFEGMENVLVEKIDLGAVSPPTALTYIDNGYVFVSSACGDSLLISLVIGGDGQESTPSKGKGKGRAQETIDAGAWNITLLPDSHAEVIQHERWMNIAPVKDFAVVEEDDGRVSHLAVASGAGNVNSLRIVRSGVGFDDVLSVEGGLTEVTRMWSLPASEPTLLISSMSRSLLLRLEPRIEVVPAPAAVTAQTTLAAGIIPASEGVEERLVQVTPGNVHLWSDILAGTLPSSYGAGKDNEIVAAAVDGDNVVAVFRDGMVSLWKAGALLSPQTSAQLGDLQVAAVAISATLDQVAISDWKRNIVVYNTNLQEITRFTEQDSAMSLLYTSSTLNAGLGDGTFVYYDMNPQAARKPEDDKTDLADSLQGAHITDILDPNLSDLVKTWRIRRSQPTSAGTQISLGSYPLSLLPLNVHSGDDCVVAAGVSERLSLIFSSGGHIEVSASGKKGVIAAASFNTPSLGTCIVLATAEGLCFTRLTSLKKLQVQTLDLGDKSVNRLATVPDLKLLAAGTVTQTLAQDNGDVMQGFGVEIRNPTTLELLATYELPPREAVTSVNAAFLNGKRYIAVGTAVFSSDDIAEEAQLDELSSFIRADKGRLILLEPILLDNIADPRWTLEDVAMFHTSSAVLDATTIHGLLAIATPSKVSILRLENDEGKMSLVETGRSTLLFEAHFLTVSHSSEGEMLVVGDAMRSILVLDVDPDHGTIRWNQRDMSSHEVRALAEVRDNGPGVVIADAHDNVLTFRLKTDIEPAAMFGLHEEVARFRPGSFGSTAPDTLQPNLVFATCSGRLGIIGELGGSATRTLDDLQRNMNRILRAPGDGTSWKEFRRGGSLAIPKETLGFIDGDYLQAFFGLDAEAATKALEGTSSHEQVHRIGEHGTREPATRAHVVRLLESVAGQH